MALGKRAVQQSQMFLLVTELPQSPAHPYYSRLNRLLSSRRPGRAFVCSMSCRWTRAVRRLRPAPHPTGAAPATSQLPTPMKRRPAYIRRARCWTPLSRKHPKAYQTLSEPASLIYLRPNRRGINAQTLKRPSGRHIASPIFPLLARSSPPSSPFSPLGENTSAISAPQNSRPRSKTTWMLGLRYSPVFHPVLTSLNLTGLVGACWSATSNRRFRLWSSPRAAVKNKKPATNSELEAKTVSVPTYVAHEWQFWRKINTTGPHIHNPQWQTLDKKCHSPKSRFCNARQNSVPLLPAASLVSGSYALGDDWRGPQQLACP